MRVTTVLLSSTLAFAAAAPAFAEMRTSVPAKQATKAAVSESTGVATGNDQYRPTRILGVERGQVLGNGNVVMGLGNGLSFGMGVGNNMEVGLRNASLFASTAPNFALPVDAYGKMLLANSSAVTVGVGARLGLDIQSPFGMNAGVFLPISLWKIGPGNLHVVPSYNPVIVNAGGSNFGASQFNMAFAYEMPVMANWSLLVADSVNGAGGNSLNIGSRVALSPNLTADVGSINLNGSVLSVNLINLTGYFGGSTSTLTKAWGL